MEDRKCPTCGNKVMGRSDKKYCSDQCRSEFYNKKNQSTQKFVQEINSILKKNRNILADLNPDGKKVVSERKLLENSFNFHYHTNIYRTKAGRTYFYCYDQGYCINEDTGEVLLVVIQDYIQN